MAGMVVVGWLSLDPLPADNPWYGLATGWETGGLLALAGTDSIPPLNAAALFFHTARFGMGPGVCGFGVLAYMAVGLCTYALARRYAWPPMALTVTLLVLSMPRLAVLGRCPSAELVSTAAVSFALVLVYRLVEQHRSGDLGFFLLCILFSIYDNVLSIALVPVMALLMMVVMIRRHGWLMWRELMAANPISGVLALFTALGLAQIPAFALNLANAHPLFGMVIVFDNDGIIGAAANLVRFVFISVDPTEAVQRMLVWLLGLDLNRLLMGVYKALVVPVFGHAGGDGSFAPVFSDGGHMGFGPFACCWCCRP